jgi:ketosteroid isomerase-like protein
MSEGNVGIVRQAYERFNAGDVEGFMELCAPDFEFQDLPSLPGSGVFEGHEGFRAWWAQLADAFDQLRFQPEGFVEATGDRVLAENHATGLGKGSRANVEMSMYNVWTLRDGRVISLRTYEDRTQALEAAGLSE